MIVADSSLLIPYRFIADAPSQETLRSFTQAQEISDKMSSQQLPEIQLLSTGTALPIPTFTIHREISGTPTELSIQTYDDRIMVLLGQLGNKVGCLVSHGPSFEPQRRELMLVTVPRRKHLFRRQYP